MGKYSHQCVLSLSPKTSSTLPIVVNIGNLTPATNKEPALLRHREVVTQFHEFGHAIHAILAKTKHLRHSWSWDASPYIAGVENDFLEVPSQLFENWAFETEILLELSSHYKTNEPLPMNLINSIKDSKNVCAGLSYSRQAFMSLIDLKLHSREFGNEIMASDDPVDLITRIWNGLFKETLPLGSVDDIVPGASWYHISMGYDAGYYSYLYSRVLAVDFYSVFESVDDSVAGDKFRRFVCEPGASIDGDVISENFLGRKPDGEAFFRDLGVV